MNIPKFSTTQWVIIGVAGIGVGLLVARNFGSSAPAAPQTAPQSTAPAPVAPTKADSAQKDDNASKPRLSGAPAEFVTDSTIIPPATPITTIVPPPVAQNTTKPIVAPVTEITRVYPGLPDGFVMNCANNPILHGDVRDPSSGGDRSLSQTFRNRNRLAIAVQGNVTPWIGDGGTYFPDKDIAMGFINRTRVKSGLYPLTRDEMIACMGLIWANTKDTSNPSEAAIRAVFETYNLPYRCGSASVRR